MNNREAWFVTGLVVFSLLYFWWLVRSPAYIHSDTTRCCWSAEDDRYRCVERTPRVYRPGDTWDNDAVFKWEEE